MFDQVIPFNMQELIDSDVDILEKKSIDIEDSNASMMQLLQYGLPATAVGAFDTFGQSILPETIFDEDTVLGMFDTLDDGLGKFYSDHRDGSQIAGDLTFGFIPILGAARLVRSGSMLDKALGAGKTGKFLRKAIISSGRTREDRVADLNMARQIFKDNKLLSMQDDGTDLIYKSIFNKNRIEAAADMAKESIAMDLSIVATMNQSDMYFPEDLSAYSNAALFLVPDALLTGLSYRFTSTAMKKWMQTHIPEDMAKVLNPLKLPQTDTLFREGFRGAGVSIHAVNASIARMDMGNIGEFGTEALRASGKQRLEAAKVVMSEELVKMYKDNPIGHGITHAIEKGAGTPELQNLLKQVELDPSMIVPVISVEGLTRQSQHTFFRNLEKRVADVDGQIAELRLAINDTSKVLSSVDKKLAMGEVEELRNMKRQLDNLSSPVVLEADGTLTPLRERKWSIIDDLGDMRTEAKSDAGEKIIALTKGEATDVGMAMGVTAHGKLLIAPLKEEQRKTALGGVSTIQIFDSPTGTQIAKEFDEEMSLNLFAAGRDWHFNTGQLGREVFETLSPRQKDMIKSWVGGSSGTTIRNQGTASDDVLDIIQAFRKKGFTRQMHEIADDNGTVLLYRGQSKAETANPTNDIVSVSTNPKIAKAFAGGGGDVLKMRVPVDDMLFPVGGLKSDEFEFIVKNQVSRIKDGVREGNVIRTAVGEIQEEAFTAMSWKQRGYALGLMQKALNKYDFAKDGMVTLHPGSSWMEKDFAVQLMMKNPDTPVVQMVSGAQSGTPALRDLVFSVLEGKFEEFQKIELIRRRAKGGVLKLKDEQKLSIYDTARAVNLPTGTTGGMHPLLTVFEELMPLQGGQIRKLNSFVKDLDQLDELMVKHINEGRLGEALATDRKYSGSMLRHDHSDQFAPSLLIQDGRQPGRFGPDEIALLVTERKEWQNAMFKDSTAQGAPFIAGIMEEILGRPDALRKATRPDLILEIPPVNRGIVGQQSQTFLGNPVLENIDRIVDLTEKRALRMTTEMFNQEFKSVAGATLTPTKTFNQLFSKNHEASLDLMNNAINSLRQGWRVEKGFGKLDNSTGFVLKLDVEDKFNRKRYQELFGRSLEADSKLMPNGVPVPIRASTVEKSGEMPVPLVLDEMSIDGLRAVTKMSHQFLDNLNHLRKIRRMNPMTKKAWHIPAVNMKKGVNVYMVDASGRVKDTINRATHGDAWRAANKEALESTSDGRHLVPVSEDNIMQYHDTLGDIWQEARSYTYSEHQTGAATGRSGTVAIETGDAPLKDLIGSLQGNFSLLTRHTRATFFESELNYSRTAIMANSAASKGSKVAKSTQQQMYENVILQRPALNPNGYVGKLYYATESVVDDIMRGIWDKVHTVKTPTAAASGANFERMQKTLGDYNPFKSVDDMIRKTTKTNVPPTMRAAVAKMNGFTTDMVLRIFDMGMPLINFASLLSVTPAVARALHRMPDETHDAWLSRIGAVGSPIDADTAIPNTGRLIQQGMEMWFSTEGARIRNLAASRGYLKQEVAERLNLWTRPKEGYMKSVMDNALDFASKPTDWSENMSRDIAFMSGFHVGKKTFKLGDEEAMLFAHIHGNKIIGDFRPNNRPQMFQGAAGMPMGLFTTWAINWLQRVFGDIEAGRAGAAVWQAAIQQMMFGAESLPGVSTFIEQFTTTYDGKRNVTDSMDEMYGRDFTDWFLHGTIASLSGVAVQSRADVSLPAIMTGESLGTAVPSFSVMNTLYEGLSAGFSSIRQNGGYNGREMSEIVATYGVNGMVRTLAEQINGQAVDRRGATINANVRDWETQIPRMFELKSMRELRKAKELHRDRMQQITERGHMDRLSKQLRSASRAGTMDGELLQSAIMDYIKNGGSPQNFKRYLKEQILVAQFDVSTRLLLKALRQSDEQGKAMRLMNVLMVE